MIVQLTFEPMETEILFLAREADEITREFNQMLRH